MKRIVDITIFGIIGAMHVLSKVAAFIYIFVSYRFKRKKYIESKDMLIIFPGHMGDVIIDLYGIKLLNEYSQKLGGILYFLCSKSAWNTINKLTDTSGMKYLDIGYPDEGTGTTFNCVKKIVHALKDFKFDKIIVMLGDVAPLGNYIVAALNCNESIAVFDLIKRKPGIRYFFQRAYSNPIYIDYNIQEAQRFKKILCSLGIENPLVKLCHIEFGDSLCNAPKAPYITIALDAACTERRWVPEYFAEITNYIHRATKYDVIYTGGKEAKVIYEKCMEKVEYPYRTRSYIDKTSLYQWFELLRNGKLHIGVDSGSIHVAASLGVQAVCLATVAEGNRIYPYVLDCVDDGIKKPIIVYPETEMKCRDCKAKSGRYAGYGNRHCRRLCKKKMPCMCMWSIKPMRVCQVLKSVLQI